MSTHLIDICARAAYEANRAYCNSLGDPSQPSWYDAPDEHKVSYRKGVLGALAGNAPEQSHESWLKEKEATGWKYGPVKDPDKKEHPCFVPYAELPPAQRVKDALFTLTVRSVAHALGCDFAAHGHLVGGDFQSDKYPLTPRGKVPLSTKDPAAQDLLWEYAHRRRTGSHGSRERDPAFSDAVQAALVARGFTPLTHRPSNVDPSRTACGLVLKRFPVDRPLQLGDGDTCPQCAHVVAQVAAVRPSREYRVTSTIANDDADAIVTASLPGHLIFSDKDVPARDAGDAITYALERVGAQRVSVVITSPEPLPEIDDE
jgi:hypothetical protein